jgi:lipid A oxidase
MVLFLVLAVQGEVQISFYAGRAWTLDSEIEYADRTTEVSWADESFESPYYYGARVGYFFDRWGVALDFFHAKVFLDDPVEGVDELAISHGYNVLTLNLIHRWEWNDWLTPYFGAGLGVVIAHVEANIGGERVSEHQIEAPAAQGLAGLAIGFVFVEAKLTWGDLELDVPVDRLETHLLTPQLVAGLTLSF